MSSDGVGDGVGVGAVGVGLGGVADGDGLSPVPPGSDGPPVVTDGAADDGTEAGADAAGADVTPPGRASRVARPVRVAPGEWASVAGTTEGLPTGFLTGPGGSAVSLTDGSGAGAVVADTDSRT
ncbi:hypothetical protein [Streptomyces sp. LN549]|uniref:hypothetical protein n=1 Tax=Streptomyces sp. LN549 TaxID=3112979 RepID=UPI0037181B8D